MILDLSGLQRFGWVRAGVGRAQAGIRLADFDRQARPHGWELRWLPSTFRSATLGGLFGGGFGGAGSITYGPVAAPGNVLGARVMTVEPEPRVVELRAPDAMLLHHTYGTNGIVLELEVALAPALPWLECIATFAVVRRGPRVLERRGERAGHGQEGGLLHVGAGRRLHDGPRRAPAAGLPRRAAGGRRHRRRRCWSCCAASTA